MHFTVISYPGREDILLVTTCIRNNQPNAHQEIVLLPVSFLIHNNFPNFLVRLILDLYGMATS